MLAVLFCSVVCVAHASAQAPVAPATGVTIDVGLGYSYVNRAETPSNRVGLNGADASFTIGYSRVGLEVDVGYARAANILGTGRHTDVLSYMAGPVFHPTLNRKFDTYIQALAGAARVSGPVPLTGGGYLLGGWATAPAWAVGGGVDYWATDAVVIRTGVDYIKTSYFVDSSLVLHGQNNIRTTVAVVYYFQRRSRRRR